MKIQQTFKDQAISDMAWLFQIETTDTTLVQTLLNSIDWSFIDSSDLSHPACKYTVTTHHHPVSYHGIKMDYSMSVVVEHAPWYRFWCKPKWKIDLVSCIRDNRSYKDTNILWNDLIELCKPYGVSVYVRGINTTHDQHAAVVSEAATAFFNRYDAIGKK